MKKIKQDGIITRSTKIDVIVSKEKKQEIINSIRLYRHICRQGFTASALAEISGGKIEGNSQDGYSIKPSDNAKKLLQIAYGGKEDAKAHFYELRNFIKEEEAPCVPLCLCWTGVHAHGDNGNQPYSQYSTLIRGPCARG